MHQALTLVDAHVVVRLAERHRREPQLLVDRLGGVPLHWRAARCAAIQREVHAMIETRESEPPSRRGVETPRDLVGMPGVPAQDAVLEVVEAQDVPAHVDRDVAEEGRAIRTRRLCFFRERRRRGHSPLRMPMMYDDEKHASIATNSKQQTSNNKQQTTNNKQQTTNNKQQTTNNKQQTTNNKQQ